MIGVGLNVNNHFSSAPEELQATCIALADRSGTSHDRVEILRVFLQRFEALIKSFAAGASILDGWPRYCLLSGKKVTLRVGDDQVTGICRGIDAAGALMLEIDGQAKRFFGGVIQSWD